MPFVAINVSKEEKLAFSNLNFSLINKFRKFSLCHVIQCTIYEFFRRKPANIVLTKTDCTQHET